MLEKYPDVLKVNELIEILRIGRGSVYKLLTSGAIKSRKHGEIYIISKEAVIEYLRNQKTQNLNSKEDL